MINKHIVLLYGTYILFMKLGLANVTKLIAVTQVVIGTEYVNSRVFSLIRTFIKPDYLDPQ